MLDENIRRGIEKMTKKERAVFKKRTLKLIKKGQKIMDLMKHNPKLPLWNEIDTKQETLRLILKAIEGEMK